MLPLPVWLKRSLALALIVLLVYQIKSHGDFTTWWSVFLDNWTNGNNKQWLVIAILLMPLNWLLEIAKWRLLLRHNWKPRWTTLVQAVLAGISVSLITPNRIGEYGGRAILVPLNQVPTVMITTFIGSICQWIGLVCFGWPALVFLLGQKEGWDTSWIWVVALFVPFVVLLLTVFIRPLFKWLLERKIGQQQKWVRWTRMKLWYVRRIEKVDLMGAFLLALFRLFVYTTQYLLLLWFFNISLTFWLGVSGIFSIYLIQAGIPLPPGLGVITRSELAIWVWGSKVVNPIGILSATFSLYLINLVIPALLGSWLIVKRKNSNPEP